MDYFDEFRRMQKMFDELNGPKKLLDEINRQQEVYKRASALMAADAHISEIQSKLAIASPKFESLAARFESAAAGLAQFESPIDRFSRSFMDQWREPNIEIKAAALTSFMQKSMIQPEYKEWNQSLAALARSVRSTYDLVRDVGVGSLSQDLTKNFDWMRNIGSASSPVLGMLAGDLLSGAAAGALRPALVEGFGAEVLGYISRAENVSSEDEVAGFLQAFLAWLLEQAQKLPATYLNRGALFSIFFTVSSLLYSEYSSQQSEIRLSKSIHEVHDAENDNGERLEHLEQLISEMKDSAAKESNRREYVVVKFANLRSGPGRQFEVLRRLPPNLFIEEIGRSGNWSHIKFFDYAEGRAGEGWVSVALLVERSRD